MGHWNRIKIGDQRGLLTIIAIDPGGTAKHPRYVVKCKCGKEYAVRGGTLSTALGCKKCRPGGAKRKYGDRTMQNVRLYHAWIHMRRRCDPTVEPVRNKHWGLRGIRVCKEWDESFETFEKWSMENGYKPGLILDRFPDHDGNYEPNNCEWVTRGVNSSRGRAHYRMIRTTKIPIFYDEPTFGDF